MKKIINGKTYNTETSEKECVFNIKPDGNHLMVMEDCRTFTHIEVHLKRRKWGEKRQYFKYVITISDGETVGQVIIPFNTEEDAWDYMDRNEEKKQEQMGNHYSITRGQYGCRVYNKLN